MLRSAIACLHPRNPRLPSDALVGDPAVPWGKGLTMDAIGQAAGTMGCGPACAILRRVCLAED